VGGTCIGATHESPKVGGPRRARPNTFRRLWCTLLATGYTIHRQ